MNVAERLSKNLLWPQERNCSKFWIFVSEKVYIFINKTFSDGSKLSSSLPVKIKALQFWKLQLKRFQTVYSFTLNENFDEDECSALRIEFVGVFTSLHHMEMTETRDAASAHILMHTVTRNHTWRAHGLPLISLHTYDPLHDPREKKKSLLSPSDINNSSIQTNPENKKRGFLTIRHSITAKLYPSWNFSIAEPVIAFHRPLQGLLWAALKTQWIMSPWIAPFIGAWPWKWTRVTPIQSWCS